MKSDIHQTSIIHPGTVLGRNVKVGAYTTIEEGCEVGDNTKIENRVGLGRHTKLGEGVWINPNTVIGAFNYPPAHCYPIEENTQFGTVIKDGVSIGSCCTVCAGKTRNTLIKSNTAVRHLCNVGHDVIIGEDTMLSAGSILGGYVEVGKETYIGMSTDIRQRAIIGDHVYIGMGSLVIRDIPDYSFGYGRPMEILGRTDDIKIKARLMSHNIRRRIRRVLK